MLDYTEVSSHSNEIGRILMGIWLATNKGLPFWYIGAIFDLSIYLDN